MLRHKDSVLRAHCEAVGRDQAQIERTVGCKPIIRDTEAEARRAWEASMELNRTPMADVEDDNTFWVGTPEQIAETMVACRDIGFCDLPGRDRGAVRRRDARALDRRGQADGGRRLGLSAVSGLGPHRAILDLPMFKFLSRLGDSNEREVRALEPIVERINELEPEIQALSDDELRCTDRCASRPPARAARRHPRPDRAARDRSRRGCRRSRRWPAPMPPAWPMS